MKVNNQNIKFIKIFLLIGLITAVLAADSFIPSKDNGVISGAVTSESKNPAQQSILISLSALLGILVVIILVIVLFIRNERLLKHFFN